MPLEMMQNKLVLKLLRLVLLFTFLGSLFWYFPTTYAHLIWWVLVACALGWLVIELRNRGDKDLRKAARIGIFLMLFDFVVENMGKAVGLWESHNGVFFVFAVPLEVMLIALIGGTAWAIYQPEAFMISYSLADIAVFATFGALGELILIQKALLSYGAGWNSLYAFLGYTLTWTILHALIYGGSIATRLNQNFYLSKA